MRAKNIYGWGPYSTVATLRAASKPGTMDKVTTTVVSGEVKIAFTPPAANGEDITHYDIEIRYSDGTTFAEDTTDCDGATA